MPPNPNTSINNRLTINLSEVVPNPNNTSINNLLTINLSEVVPNSNNTPTSTRQTWPRILLIQLLTIY